MSKIVALLMLGLVLSGCSYVRYDPDLGVNFVRAEQQCRWFDWTCREDLLAGSPRNDSWR